MPRASQTPALAKLDFSEPLIQTGKRETTEALLKRIKTLNQKLSTLEQDAVDVKSLDPIRKPLIKDAILHHKDRGVKAYAACCLADLLRLYAPDAPYSESQLRDIFNFFLVQLTTNLKLTTSSTQPLQISRNKSNIMNQPSHPSQTQSQRVTDIPYYTEYYHLIESLATIKSVVLVCDVPDSDTLMEGFFNGFMEIIRPDMNKTLIRYLRDILVALIEEASQLPQGVMDCLISQFENYASKPEVLSFQLTVDVCNQVADKLKRPIYAHFSEIQVEHGRDPSANDIKKLTESHDLLLTIYKFCPDLLLNVVPLLEENLKVSDELTIRQLSVRTLGALFSQRIGTEDPSKKYPSTWRAWLGRRVDKAFAVRLTWVEGTKGLLINHPEVRLELQAELRDRIVDSDERIRAAICRVIGSLDYETALHHISLDTLKTIGERMSDKKSSVRSEAAGALAKLWNLAYSEIESSSPEAIKQFAWIPEAMLLGTCRGNTTTEMRVQLISVIKSSILPLPKETDDEQAWVDRLLSVTSRLNDDAFAALRKIIGLADYAKGNSPFMAFIHFCEEYNGGVITEGSQDAKPKLDFVIDAIARSYFGDVDKAKRDLTAFAHANESKLFKLYKTCVDIQSSLTSIVKARNELLRRVHQSHDDVLETITCLVDVSSWNIVNQSSISPLLKRVSKPESAVSAAAASKVLGILAKEGAPLFKTHAAQLVIAMMDKKNEHLVELALQALGSVCKIYPDVAPAEHRPVERAVNLALEGTPRQAKFAARFLARSKEPDACDNVVDGIVKAFKKKDRKHLLTHLRALTELALIRPRSVEARSEEIMSFIMKEIINAPSPSIDVEDDKWVEYDTLQQLNKAKILSLKFLTHRTLGFSRDPEADKILRPVLKLLTDVLVNDGMMNENTQEGGAVRCHLRLKASVCLLKLANVRSFDKAIAEQCSFDVVVGAVQDFCYMVRHVYLRKLGKVVPTQRLLARWNITPIMIAMDPEEENKKAGHQIMQRIVATCSNLSAPEKVDRIEMPFARLLHFLCHHPDIHWTKAEEGEEIIADQQNLQDVARFIEMYLDCVAHRYNIGLLFAIAQGLKGLRDKMDERSRPLYILSELAQIIIRNRAERHAWPIPIYPGKIRFPKDIFHHADNYEEKSKIQHTQYLTEEVREWAKTLGRRIVNTGGSAPRKAEINNHTRPSPTSNKRKSAAAGSKKSAKKRRVEESDGDDDDDDDDEDEDSDEDEEDDEEGSGEEAEEEEDGEDASVLGRGGRRGAKTKAKRAVSGKKAKKAKVKKAEDQDKAEDSDLTDLEE
uniref:Sister chromatid cohesion protein PDS5 n=1 Tax=Kwoniella dejecticola CBS 10117 TaxID=1296121 RepID=A0A1A6AC19_9TREE|nr:uncharacterized protein I303_01812 [Kwoniella dejecticola CBS 10117]OBR87604.1 hypothetical protein I303_01812 [Kwoniella dejecticola CBS 10117]